MSRKQVELVFASLTLILITSQIVQLTTAMHIPGLYASRFGGAQRRQDSDMDDDMDSSASGPYQNQDEGNNGGATDGYGDNDQDGNYEETPRDEEGQADLERFFDDHLGASEREGMDKENLPSELVHYVMKNPQLFNDKLGIKTLVPSSYQNQLVATPTLSRPGTIVLDSGEKQVSYSHRQRRSSNSDSNYNVRSQASDILPRVLTKYLRSPNEKLIITRQITSDSLTNNGLSQAPTITTRIYRQNDKNNVEGDEETENSRINNDINKWKAHDKLDMKGSEIVATENDDMDPIYVTNVTNKPFKIDALGGYDPEEDFKDATRDIEESSLPARHENSDESSRGRSNKARHDEQETRLKDVTFNDPEADMLFNDASETDEITFGQDDPYQTDLEAEMREQAYDKPGTIGRATSRADGDHSARASTVPKNAKRIPVNEDDSDAGWVNDGVEDMEIPSQSYQEAVLDKAARAQARKDADEANEAASAAAEEENAEPKTEQQDQQHGPEEESEETGDQRMPNADYLRDYMKIDDRDESLR